LQFAADHGNSVAASMWHAGGFETRHYKRPDCAMRNGERAMQKAQRGVRPGFW